MTQTAGSTQEHDNSDFEYITKLPEELSTDDLTMDISGADPRDVEPVFCKERYDEQDEVIQRFINSRYWFRNEFPREPHGVRDYLINIQGWDDELLDPDAFGVETENEALRCALGMGLDMEPDSPVGRFVISWLLGKRIVLGDPTPAELEYNEKGEMDYSDWD